MVFTFCEAAAFLGCNSSQPTTTEKVAQKWPRKLEAFANQIVKRRCCLSPTQDARRILIPVQDHSFGNCTNCAPDCGQ